MKLTGRKDIKETQRKEGGMKMRRSRKSRGNRGAGRGESEREMWEKRK